MKKSFALMALAMAAAFFIAGCEKEVQNRVPGTDTGDSEFSSKVGVQVANSSTNHGESRFNYDNWKEQTTIDIYDKNKKECDEINLPWAKVSSTSMPSAYKHPEREFQADGVTPRWELAFNFCDWETIPGTDMFGLWDSHAQLMRIYTYIEQLPNQNAKNCFFEVRSTAPNYINPDTRGWMPTDFSIKDKNWPFSINGGLPVPSQDFGELLPITGTLEGQVNPGWLCFEIAFNSGICEVNKTDNITFTLLGAENIKFTGSMDISGQMACTDGTITIPGNKNKVAGGVLNAIGSFFSGLATSITQGHTTEQPAVAAVGIGGAICSLVGNSFNAAEEGKDKVYKLNMSFNITATAEINGSLTTNLGTTSNSIQIDYDVLFGNIIEHRAKAAGNKFTMGLWNLKNPPEIYVAEDAFFKDEKIEEGSSSYAYGLYHPSFLDPRSLELEINTDEAIFPLEEISKIRVLSYDFVFVNDKYDLPAQPYYDYYGVSQDSFLYARQRTNIISYDYKQSLLDPTVKPETKTHVNNGQHYVYSGTADTHTDFGMDVYDMICSPVIHRMPDTSSEYKFDQLGVAAVLEIEFKNGDLRVFADRFLPRIKAFSIYEADSLKTVMSNTSQIQSIAGIPVENPLFEAQKAKAVRVLEKLGSHADTYPAVHLDSPILDHHSGLLVRRCTKESRGIVLVTAKNLRENLPYQSCLEWLHGVLNEIDDWDAINDRLEALGLERIDQAYAFHDDMNYEYNIKTGNKTYAIGHDQLPGINIFALDTNGKLSLLTHENEY